MYMSPVYKPAQLSRVASSRLVGQVLSPDDQQVRGKLVEIDFHPELILDLLPIFINLDDAAARIHDSLNVIGNSPVVLKRWQPLIRGIPVRTAVEVAMTRLWSVGIQLHPPNGMIVIHDEQPNRFQDANGLGIVLLDVGDPHGHVAARVDQIEGVVFQGRQVRHVRLQKR